MITGERGEGGFRWGGGGGGCKGFREEGRDGGVVEGV